jgi:ADP-heptose:LPS heptosyltransferase
MDCQQCLYKPRAIMPDARRIILKNTLSPGDILCMTAAVHSLHRANPGRFVTALDTIAKELWEHNPDVYPLEKARQEGFEEVPMHYPLIHQSNQRAVHVMMGFCDYLENLYGVRVPLLCNRPLLFLSHQEQQWMSQVQEVTKQPTKFWLVNAGRKDDFTCKFWGTRSFQKVVDGLKGVVQFVQVGEAQHHHPRLEGVIDLVGKTNVRQLVRLVYHAQGCLTGVSFLHHLAAAWEKPCVTIMGGREPVPWNTYPRCHLLHTIGTLPCCKLGGCWKSRVVKLEDASEQNASLCERPLVRDGETIPECLASISPDHVLHLIEKISSCP